MTSWSGPLSCLEFLSSSERNAGFGVGGRGERGNGGCFGGSGNLAKGDSISSLSAPGLRSRLLGRVDAGVSGRTLTPRLPVLERLRKFCFRFSLISAIRVRGFLGGSYRELAFEGTGGASGPVENRSSLNAAPKLCSERGRVAESERVSPTAPLRYLEDLLSLGKMKPLDRRARAIVTPEIAEDKGVSIGEIGERREVFISRVS